MIARAVAFWVVHFCGTVTIAKLDKHIRAELARRKEYALRFQIHAPSQWTGR